MLKRKTGKESSRKEVEDFFARLVVVVVDPTGRPCFLVGDAIDPAGWPYFGAVVGLFIGLGGADGLEISGAVLTGFDIAISFSELFLR